MSCLLTADAIASYNGCSENEIIWNDEDSPWYLTTDTPYTISNKAGFYFGDFDVGDGCWNPTAGEINKNCSAT